MAGSLALEKNPCSAYGTADDKIRNQEWPEKGGRIDGLALDELGEEGADHEVDSNC